MKKVNKGLFFSLVPINSIITELVFVILAMGILKSMVVDINLLSALPIILIGLFLCCFNAVIEMLIGKKRDMQWWYYLIAGYIIPVIFWGVLSLVTVTVWWSDRNAEDSVVGKWITLSMLIYISCACACRIFGHVFYSLVVKIKK